MKSIAIACLAVSVTLGAFARPAAAAPEDGIKQAFAQLDKCGDAKCIGDLMVDDATLSEPMNDAKVVKGKAQIVKTFEGLMSGAPNSGGAKPTHVVDNIRLVGTEYAIVDSSVQVPGMKAPDGAPGQKLHALAVMVLKGDKWLFQDVRSYAVGPAYGPPKKEAPVAMKDAAAPPKDAASPDKAPPPADKQPAPAAKEPAPHAVD